MNDLPDLSDANGDTEVTLIVNGGEVVRTVDQLARIANTTRAALADRIVNAIRNGSIEPIPWAPLTYRVTPQFLAAVSESERSPDEFESNLARQRAQRRRVNGYRLDHGLGAA